VSQTRTPEQLRAVKPPPLKLITGGENGDSTAERSTDRPEIVQEIQQQYGIPAYWDKKSEFIDKLNEPFWAGLYAKENIIIHEFLEQCFYNYNQETGLYSEQSEDELLHLIAERILSASRQWGTRYAGLSRFRGEFSIRGIIRHLRGQVKKRDFFQRNLDAETQFVHLADCMLRLDKNGYTREEFSPEYHSRNRSPIKYDPGAECQEFQDKLLAPLGDDDRQLLQKFFGQFILGINKSQRILLLDGKPGAGKSTLAEVIRRVVGEYNCEALRTEQLESSRFELGRFIDRTLLIGADVKDRFLSSPGAYKLKSMVGGDMLPAELKRSNARFRLRGILNILITSNARLRVWLQGDYEAWLRRLTIIRYENPRKGKRIDDFANYLILKEASGILNWALDGLVLLIEDLKNFGDMKISERQNGFVETLLCESDSLKLFVRGNIVRTSEEKATLTVNEIIEEYYKDCASKQWSPEPAGDARSKLEDFMMEYFGASKSNSVKREGKDQRGFFHVRFRKPDEEDPTEPEKKINAIDEAKDIEF
jgi:hypothetical protein